ncbi:MAG: hypothetical protein JO323_13130, partial [Acidobacteriia bacterium]|nr:hypothetical protein [Terriglobia bacterium]
YANLKSSALDANTFNRNSNGRPKLPEGDEETGYWAGGPLPWRNWRLSSALDFFHAHSNQDAESLPLPTFAFVESLPADSFLRQLLTREPPRFWAPASDGSYGLVSFQPPLAVTRWTALDRADFRPSASQQFQLQAAASGLKNPDFNWSPYGEAPLRQSTVAGALVWNGIWSSAFTTTLRLGWHFDHLNWSLVDQGLPVLSVSAMEIPGTYPAGGFAYDDRSHTGSLEGGAQWNRGRNVLKAGGGWTTVAARDRFSYEPSGVLYFADLASLVADRPAQFEAVVSRTAYSLGEFREAALRGLHSYAGAYSYVQEDFRLAANLTLNGGLRVEHFGAPVASASVPDTILTLPAGLNPAAGVAFASYSEGTNPFKTQSWQLAPRMALAYSPRVHGRDVVLRAGWGLFHDALYDNLWSDVITNDGVTESFNAGVCPFSLGSLPVSSASVSSACANQPSNFLNPVIFRSPLKLPVIQSFFLGAEAAIAPGWTLSVNGLASSGRNLISTDILNRLNENPHLPNVYYRSNEGRSNYAALTVSVRRDWRRTALRAFYTWSHSIDNQSDPLLGDFFDLGFSNQTDRVGVHYYGAFTKPNDYDGDRGNSDFDQRHNFALLAAWEVPKGGRLHGLTAHWRMSGIFVARSGLPYSVYAGSQSCDPICNTRANLMNPAVLYADLNSFAVPGGRQLLNPAAFAPPADGQNGNTGRNAFAGPGFWDADFSLGRDFSLPRLGETTRLTLRADAFNIWNHANLQPPDAYWGVGPASPNASFGSALFGRTEKTGFPALTPFVENARQIQVLARLNF